MPFLVSWNLSFFSCRLLHFSLSIFSCPSFFPSFCCSVVFHLISSVFCHFFVCLLFFHLFQYLSSFTLLPIFSSYLFLLGNSSSFFHSFLPCYFFLPWSLFLSSFLPHCPSLPSFLLSLPSFRPFCGFLAFSNEFWLVQMSKLPNKLIGEF